MPGGDAIAESLKRRRVTKVCHMTLCSRLPNIFRYGGLLSYSERQRFGIDEGDQEHFWGNDGDLDKKNALASFVLCAFMPPWWMCQAHNEELALLTLDAEATCCADGALFCPENSAKGAYPVHDILASTGVSSFDECFPNPETYQALHAEILVPTRVPITAFRDLIFCDEEAREYWLPKVKNTEREVYVPPPPDPISVRTHSVSGFRFPANFTPSTRVRP